ncbi:peptide-methionine (S)-S-oxide reductase [Pseudomonas sp. ok272]|uniref:peptide-methionine (S)-S-oxide reductase MsrA n=1 Tax=unclassified Pseudomonas TaxID=196821 RepID=UPI0008C9322D|nr:MULTISPECIES: peptide-methionine (S)-S-oxide reductase MsrA [unclassified Pseudomonas]SEN31985.1 peptide-methionine (S)-S-oxide reductase [Pseudomonas sp. ok272]SFN18889.1 peptide-methionine (S)-S-oxide reductase [Pseudomonas sp. ok602]
MKTRFTWRQTLLGLALAGVVGQSLAWSLGAAADAVAIAPPALDETPRTGSETAVFAGGCFWGVQGVFQHVKGVTSAVSGYAGGAANTARYEQVGGGETGHAESVQVTFDPVQVSYGSLLQIYFSVAHNPTELNRQGPDSGTQYRSALFVQSPEQQRIAQAYIAQLDTAHAFAKPIVTTLETYNGFYPAEDYHQDFLTQHPNYPYIVVNDLPKVAQLKALYPERYRDKPVLVNSGM